VRRFILAVTIASVVASIANAQDVKDDLSKDSLEQLTQVQIKVSSVSRKDEDLWDAPAAVYVITREDIANSSASSIPELLRVVPGLQVAQITASAWAVSARGFNSAYSNKLLVLVDGRTMYSEIYSGAHWDTIDLPLTSIERIEIIRGPGAAVWGTNAVNGVINIITRSARTVSGFNVRSRISNINDSAVLQEGTPLGERAQGRAYVSYVDREALHKQDGSTAFDGQSLFRGSARADWQKDSTDRVIFSGDAYGGHMRQQILSTIALPIGPNGQEHDSTVGGFALSRWEHTGQHGNTGLQAYYSDDVRHELSAASGMQTEALEFVDHLPRTSRLDLVTGAELRFTEDSIHGPVALTAQSFYFNYLLSGFAEAELTIKPHRLAATFGSKIQDGTLAGFQIQPSLRLIWTPDSRHALWAAVSRAVVAPATQDKALTLPLTSLGTYDGLTIEGTILGNPAFKPEEVIATELGYRERLPHNLSLDLATFYNRNQRIQSLTTESPQVAYSPSPYLQVNFVYGNGFSAGSEGAELALSWHPMSRFNVHLGYTWLEAQLHQKQPGTVSLVDSFDSPRNTVTASLAWQMTRNWSFSSTLSHVDPLPDSATSDSTFTANTVPSYARLDLHLLRKLGSQTLIEAGATNLLQANHMEFGSGTSFLTPAYIPRSAFARATWSF